MFFPSYPPLRSVKKRLTQIKTEKPRRSIGLSQRTFSLYPPRRNRGNPANKSAVFFLLNPREKNPLLVRPAAAGRERLIHIQIHHGFHPWLCMVGSAIADLAV